MNRPLLHANRPTQPESRSTAEAGASSRFLRSLAASSGLHGVAAAAVAAAGVWGVTEAASAPARTHEVHPIFLAQAPEFQEQQEELGLPPDDSIEIPEIDPVFREPETDFFETLEAPLRPQIKTASADSESWRALDWDAEVPEHAAAEPNLTESEADPEDAISSEALAIESDRDATEEVLLEAPAPVYPRLSVRSAEEGTVICRMHVGADGSVLRVEILESSGFDRLDGAALEALMRWRFLPRTQAGVSVPGTVRHPVTFVLDR